MHATTAPIEVLSVHHNKFMRIKPKGGCRTGMEMYLCLSLLLKEQDEVNCHVDICMGSLYLLILQVKGLRLRISYEHSCYSRLLQ